MYKKYIVADVSGAAMCFFFYSDIFSLSHHPAFHVRFSVMEVRTSRLEVLFLMFCARVKMSSS